MPNTPIHIATKNKPLKRANLHPYTALDRVVLVVSVVYPFSALPQAIAVFNGRTEGVAALSWMFFLVCASLFFVYGIKRQVPPMIISNSIWIFMDSLVLVGLFLYSSSFSWI